MFYAPGSKYYGIFATHRDDTGALSDADALPAATATRNGADDGSFSLTVVKIDTGRYKVSGTVPNGYAVGDRVQITAAATVNSVAHKLVVGEFQVFVYTPPESRAADSRTYYVRKSGNDTTGDGSSAAPWLTINKAVTSAAGGDVINVGPGTYAETNSAHYWALPTGFTRYVTIQPETGNADDVTITAADGTSYNIFLGGGVAYVRFKNLTLTSYGSAQDVIRMTVCDHIWFDHCKFLVNGATQGNSAVNGAYSGTSAAGTTNITYEHCTIRQTGSYGCYGIYHSANGNPADQSRTFPVDRISIVNCDILTMADAVVLYGVTNVKLSGGTYNGDYPHAVCIGADGENALSTTGSVEHAKVISRAGHAFILGSAGQDFGLYHNEFRGSSYALILKECGSSGHPITVRENTLIGGTVATFYVKGGNYITAQRNTIINQTTGIAVLCLKNPSGQKFGNLAFTDNKVLIGRSATGLSIGGPNDDNGGCVFDRNEYRFEGLAHFGDVKGTTGILTLAGLKAAWDSYGDGHNEEASWDVPWQMGVDFANVNQATTATTLSNITVPIVASLTGYTAPDNAGIAAVKAKTDNLPADPASNTQVNTRLAASAYTNPDNTGITSILADTEELQTKLANMIEAHGDDWRFKAGALANTFLVDMADVQDAAPNDSLCTTVLACFHFGISGNTWTIKKTDGSAKTTKSLTTDANTGVIVGVS